MTDDARDALLRLAEAIRDYVHHERPLGHATAEARGLDARAMGPEYLTHSLWGRALLAAHAAALETLDAPPPPEPRSPLLEGAAARVVEAYEALHDELDRASNEGHRVPSLKHPVGVRNAKDELDAAVEALEARLGHGRDNGPPEDDGPDVRRCEQCGVELGRLVTGKTVVGHYHPHPYCPGWPTRTPPARP